MNKIKLSLFIIISMMTQLSKAQKVSVMWNNLEKEKFELLGGSNSIEMNGNYYCMAYQMTGLIGNFPYHLVKLDGNLSLEKSIEFPYKYNGNQLEFVSIKKSVSKVIVLFKYYETSDDNRYVLLKAIFDENLSNSLEFEKVEDIPTYAKLSPYHTIGLYNYNKNNDVILMKVPREAYPNYTSYTFSSYNNDFSKRDWITTMDLGKLTEDFVLKTGYFSINKEFVFIMKAKMKPFSKIKNNMLICKFSKDKGIETKEIIMEKNDNMNNMNMFIDSVSNMVYVYGILDESSSTEDIVLIKKFSINSLEELSNSRISLGLSKTNGLKTSSHDILDFSFRGMGRNGNSDELILMGEIYRNNVNRNISGTILYLKLDNNGKMIDKKMIPRRMLVKGDVSIKPHFGSFLGSKVNDKLCLLFYDNKDNENLTEYDSKIKVRFIEDNEKQDLYMITIDENNNILKTKVEKENTGNTSKLNKKQNFEILSNTYISPGKFLVLDGTNIGVLTIE